MKVYFATFCKINPLSTYIKPLNVSKSTKNYIYEFQTVITRSTYSQAESGNTKIIL